MDNKIKIGIDSWLKKISDETVQIVYKIMSVLLVEQELQDDVNPILVDHKLKKEPPSQHWLEYNSIMKNLHQIGVLFYNPVAYTMPGVVVSPETTEIKLYLEPFRYLSTRIKEKLNKSIPFYDYDYESKTFQLTLSNGRHASINFRTKRGKKYQSTLFEVLLTEWETEQNMAIISESNLLKKISKRLKETVDKSWLKNTMRHLKETFATNQRVTQNVLLAKHKDEIIFDLIQPT